MTASSTLSYPRADQVLRQSPFPAIRKLRVEETEEAIILLGSVSTYYLKQLAQETVMPLRGARALHNRVTVRS
ncbi:MAG TPA: BON domain-containing protein [Gemmataceae bacterium]|jgi:osmotically-inducible protein OsmY|nr:BON domain-containing protein [Gemmataceae bacterium]